MPKLLALPITEAVVLSGCKALLDILKGEGLLSYRRIYSGGIPLRRDLRWALRPNTEQVGMEDLQVYLPGGKVLHIEMKSTKGRLSPEQVAWQKELKGLDHVYALVRSTEELRQVLLTNGVRHWSL